MIQLDVVDRKKVIKMNKQHDFSGAISSFKAQVNPNEYYAFQIAIQSDEYCKNISLTYGDLRGECGIIPKDNFFCNNFGGIDYLGNSFKKNIELSPGKLEVLWVCAKIPKDAKGVYNGKLEAIIEQDADRVTRYGIDLLFTVEGEILEDHGDAMPERFSRLRWLNSIKGQENTVTEPYTAVVRTENILGILGREITIGKYGLPQCVGSYYDMDLTVSNKLHEVCRELSLVITQKTSAEVEFEQKLFEYLEENEAYIKFHVLSQSLDQCFDLNIYGKVEFDGFITYEVELMANKTVEIEDISLFIPYKEEFTQYFMGLGHEGGCRPSVLDFKWAAEKHQNVFWMGGINGGIRVELLGEDYHKPHVNIYYDHDPLHMSKSFDNEGKGGICFEKKKLDELCVRAYSGKRSMQVGEVLEFNFNMLLTPLKPMDTKKRFNTRYYHSGSDKNFVSTAKESYATCMNIHHACKVNPYINYPFTRNEELKALIDEAHANDLKLKLYYTVREQSDQTVELQAFRALGDEIIPRPKNFGSNILWDNEGIEWFSENIGKDVIPAWKSHYDAAVLTNGNSRLANYYIEGLDWLIKNLGIDGIYIDDVAFNRNTMQRARRILNQKAGTLVDLHSWNHYSEYAGYANSANLYMPLMPYIDSIWFGEGFDYDRKPDYWLVELCGTPYGMSSEMLQGGGNRWRGMLFGITNRCPWSGVSPSYLWKFFIDYNIADMKMKGFWNPESPVQTNHKDILSTTYIGEDRIIIAIASWADENQTIELDIDFEKLSSNKITDFRKIYSPYIECFQDEQIYTQSGKISVEVEKGKGKLIVLDK